MPALTPCAGSVEETNRIRALLGLKPLKVQPLTPNLRTCAYRPFDASRDLSFHALNHITRLSVWL